MLRLFLCVFWPFVCLLWRNVCLDFLPIFWCSCLIFCILSYRRCLYILEINILSISSFVNIFSHSSLFFHLFRVSFSVQTFFFGGGVETHLQHMAVPVLGVELELQLLAYVPAQQHGIWAVSVTFTIAHNIRSLTYWPKPEIKPASSWILVWFLTHWGMVGTPAVQKLLSLVRSHLFNFVFIVVTLEGGSENILLWFM